MLDLSFQVFVLLAKLIYAIFEGNYIMRAMLMEVVKATDT
jgi:hypothetical protein